MNKQLTSIFRSAPILYRMPVVCAWCRKSMGVKKATKPDQVSHGICKSCKKKAMEEIR